MPDQLTPRPRVRLCREPGAVAPLADARLRARVLRWLRRVPGGRPCSAVEIQQLAGDKLRAPAMVALLERMTGLGELVAVDGLVSPHLRGPQRPPYRGYTLPPAGESGGAA